MRRLSALVLLILAPGCSAPTEKNFVNSQQKVRLEVPAGWNQPIEEGPDRGIRGVDGYVKLSAMAGPATVMEACRVEAFHRMQPYGPAPRVEAVMIDGQRGCRIIPTIANAQAHQIPAGLILQHPQPVMIEPRRVHPRPYPYLVLWVDPAHLATVERSLRFDR